MTVTTCHIPRENDVKLHLVVLHTFGSIHDLLSSADISTIKMAVQSGNPKAVDDLMERLTDTLAVDELTTTYGGYPYSSFLADGDNLFKGTSPILHTARSGNLAVFKSVMNAMQTKLSREQVTPHAFKLYILIIYSRSAYQRSMYMVHNFA